MRCCYCSTTERVAELNLQLVLDVSILDHVHVLVVVELAVLVEVTLQVQRCSKADVSKAFKLIGCLHITESA